MVGSSVVFDGPDGAVVRSAYGRSLAGWVPAAGASGGGEGCVGVEGASAQKRARSAPQRRTTPQHTDATPPQPPRVARFSSRQSAMMCAEPGRAAFAIPFQLKSMGEYDDVNHLSYSRSVRNSDATRHNNHR